MTTSKHRVKEHYDRMKAQGYKQIKIWSLPENVQALKDFAETQTPTALVSHSSNAELTRLNEQNKFLQNELNDALANKGTSYKLDQAIYGELDSNTAEMVRRLIKQQKTIQSIQNKGK